VSVWPSSVAGGITQAAAGTVAHVYPGLLLFKRHTVKGGPVKSTLFHRVPRLRSLAALVVQMGGPVHGKAW
jgi:hypothetical protein